MRVPGDYGSVPGQRFLSSWEQLGVRGSGTTRTHVGRRRPAGWPLSSDVAGSGLELINEGDRLSRDIWSPKLLFCYRLSFLCGPKIDRARTRARALPADTHAASPRAPRLGWENKLPASVLACWGI